MSFINKTFADLPPDVIISDIRKSNPCNINWIVKKIIIEKSENECSDDLSIFIQSNNWLYKVFASKAYSFRVYIWLKWYNLLKK